MIDYCISFFKEEQENETYRIYTTELLASIAKSLGVQVNMSYYDLTHPKEEKNAEEIINHIKEGLS